MEARGRLRELQRATPGYVSQGVGVLDREERDVSLERAAGGGVAASRGLRVPRNINTLISF